MAGNRLEEATRDLLWSLWTELGVPGVARRHERTVVDPEPLLLSSPVIFPLDPRLRDQVYGWCRAHADRLSLSRIQGLASALTSQDRGAFDSLAATLRRNGRARWPNRSGAQPWQREPDFTEPRLPVERPALLRLRLRALCGVGARADILSELLALDGHWVRASDLSEEGYSKRNVARILSELAQAGIVNRRQDRNVLSFQLARPDALRAITDATDLAFPRWRLVFELVLQALEISRLEPRSGSVRRVEAHRISEKMKALSHRLRLERPPETRGNSEAWESTHEWAAEQLEALAAGSSPALA